MTEKLRQTLIDVVASCMAHICDSEEGQHWNREANLCISRFVDKNGSFDFTDKIGHPTEEAVRMLSEWQDEVFSQKTNFPLGGAN